MAKNQGSTLVEAELVASIAWLIRIRWIAGVGVLLATRFIGDILHLKTPAMSLYAIGVGILVYNLFFHLIERRLVIIKAPSTIYGNLAKWQVGMDWLAMTLLIHFSGGVESPAILFFVFHIIIASIFFSRPWAFAFTSMAIGLVSGIALLEFFSVLSHEPIQGFLPDPLFQNGLFVAATLTFFSFTGIIAAYLSSSIQERLRQREEQVIRLSESLQRATIRLQALNEGARTVSSTLELPQVFNRLVKSTAEAMGVRACTIRLLDKSGKRLDPVAVFGLSQTYLDKGPVEVESNPLARAVLSGKTVNIPDAPNSPMLQYPEEAKAEGIRSMLSAPLIGKNGPFGILRAYAIETNRFKADDEAFLSAIAAQGSIAIENAMAYHAIEELDALKSQFVRMVTHELRSPVSVTRSLLRTLAGGYAGKITEQQQDILNRASHRIDFLQKLVDDLLDLAAGKTDLRANEIREPIAVEELLAAVIQRFEVFAKQKGLTLAWHNGTSSVSTDHTIVQATREGLDRVFDNLVSNAIKYNRPAGQVIVTLTNTEDETQITIEDTGIGIPAEAMSHLFEEFYRAPNAKAIETEGTGLGLTIVKDIIARFGGRVKVESTQDVGTCFTINLPRHR